MRLLVVLLVGLLTFVFTSCPAPEEATEDNTLIDDEGMRQPDFAEGDEVVAADDAAEAVEGDEAAVVCEVCGNDPCTCEMAEGEEAEAEEGEEVAAEEGEEAEAEEGEEEEVAAVCEHCGTDPCTCEGHTH